MRFACIVSREPSAVSDRDVRDPVETFGPHRAVDSIYRTAGCNYLTRVADAFQLPLERTNAFLLLEKEKKGPEPGK